MTHRWRALTAVGALALVALIGLFFLMSRLATSPTPAAPGTPVPATAPATEQIAAAVTATLTPAASATAIPAHDDTTAMPVVATVDGVPITETELRMATLIDGVMSRLTGQPLPAAGETLQRLINEIIVLRAATLDTTPLPTDEAAARIQLTQTEFGISDQQLAAALASSGLLRADLTRRTARLILVDRAMQFLAQRYPDLDTWLAEARADSDIVVRGDGQTMTAAAPPTATVAPANQPTTTPLAAEAAPDPPSPEAPTGAFPDASAPDFSLTGIDGQVLRLSELRGKPVLLNFWATWCPPCRAELPALQAAYERYAQDVVFVGVSVREAVEQVTSLVTELGLTYPVLIDPDGAVTEGSFMVTGLPTTVVIDAAGKVVARHVGPLTAEAIDGYLVPLVHAVPVQPSGASELAPTTEPPAAPQFTLDSAGGAPVSLSDYRGRSAVVLVFYRGQT